MNARTRSSWRTLAPLVALAGLAACGADTAGLAPLQWTKVEGAAPGGAVLAPGEAGAFDERGNFTARAFEDGGTTYLYYGGIDGTGDAACPGINDSHWRIGLATSTDGVTFTKVPGPRGDGVLLDLGDAGKNEFDSFMIYRPFVLKDGAKFRMWYNGAASPFNCPNGTLATDRRIGYAESDDGLTWTKKNDGAGPGGSALPLGAAGTFDAQQVGYVWVLKDGAEYKLYYSANDIQNFWRVGLAVSSDGLHWTKVPGRTVTGAVLDLGGTGTFDAACAYQPSVVKERDDLYRMWYRGCDQAGPFGGPSRGTIGYAESNDGINWVKMPQPGPTGAALVQGEQGAFDTNGLSSPSVIRGSNAWSMYYAGVDGTGRFLTGLARAPR
jgi:hypothetical protein